MLGEGYRGEQHGMFTLPMCDQMPAPLIPETWEHLTWQGWPLVNTEQQGVRAGWRP